MAEHILGALNPYERELAVMRWMQGHTLAEIGKRFGYSRTRAKQVVDTLKAHIRTCLNTGRMGRRLVLQESAHGAV